jgi:hypothetical protein
MHPPGTKGRTDGAAWRGPEGPELGTKKQKFVPKGGKNYESEEEESSDFSDSDEGFETTSRE